MVGWPASVLAEQRRARYGVCERSMRWPQPPRRARKRKRDGCVGCWMGRLGKAILAAVKRGRVRALEERGVKRGACARWTHAAAESSGCFARPFRPPILRDHGSPSRTTTGPRARRPVGVSARRVAGAETRGRAPRPRDRRWRRRHSVGLQRRPAPGGLLRRRLWLSLRGRRGCQGELPAGGRADRRSPSRRPRARQRRQARRGLGKRRGATERAGTPTRMRARRQCSPADQIDCGCTSRPGPDGGWPRSGGCAKRRGPSRARAFARRRFVRPSPRSTSGPSTPCTPRQ